MKSFGILANIQSPMSLFLPFLPKSTLILSLKAFYPISSVSSMSPKSSSFGPYEFCLLKAFCFLKSSFVLIVLETLLSWASWSLFYSSWTWRSYAFFFRAMALAAVELIWSSIELRRRGFLMSCASPQLGPCIVFCLCSRSSKYYRSRGPTKSCWGLSSGLSFHSIDLYPFLSNCS